MHNTAESANYTDTSEGCADDEANEDITNDISAEFDGEDDHESLTSDEDSISDHSSPDFTEEGHIPAQIPVPSNQDSVNDSKSDSIPNWTAKDLQISSAHFLFGIKEKYKLTQVAIQGIIEGATSLTQQCIAVLKSKVASYVK